MKRRDFISQAAVVTTGAATFLPAAAAPLTGAAGAAANTVLLWNAALTDSLAATSAGPTVAARAIAMVHEGIYNAWAVGNAVASFTVTGLQRDLVNSTVTRQAIAAAYAAYTVLVGLFPARQSIFGATLGSSIQSLGAGSSAGDMAYLTAGTAAGNAVLHSRANDGANQLGNLAPGAYSDWTGYQPVNTPDLIIDPSRWQPLRVVIGGVTQVQSFLTPHWGRVRPFALSSGSALRPAFAPTTPTQAEMAEIIALSASLNDHLKSIVDFWANNPGSVTPPGQWTQIATIAANTDGNTLEANVKLFFALGQGLLDASIACWDAKVAYDSIRPMSAIRYFYRGQSIQAWGGPGQGLRWMLGENWAPYQRPTNPNPNFGEYLSGHSTFSAASAKIIAGLRAAGDSLQLRFVFPAGGVPWDTTVPASPTALSWNSLSAAAASAGLSRRFGGIHFTRGDMDGRALGANVGNLVLARCRGLFNGTIV